MERRRFLARGATVAAGAAVAGPFQGVVAHADSKGLPSGGGYGKLSPVPDKRDGEVRLYLPKGFKYRSFNPAGSALSDGSPTPARHDGMTAFRGYDGTTILVRNHEINGPVGAFGDAAKAYDSSAGGGTVTLQVTGKGKVLKSKVSINGTQNNCSGGRTPWGSWLTCEETVNGPDVGNDFTGGDNSKLKQKHGYIFEVPARGGASRKPIRSAGRFAHEAAVVDPRTGTLYLTEDNFGFASGFYRYKAPRNGMSTGRLQDGGRLQMLAVKGKPNADLSAAQRKGATYDVTWVDIDDPDPTFTGTPKNDVAIQAVGKQGRDQGAALFSRLEGAIYHKGVVYFVSTQGGAQHGSAPDGFGDGRGQIWAYSIRSKRLRLVYESPGTAKLDLPDNITYSPSGSLVLCEDGDGANYIRGLTRKGKIFKFAKLEPVEGDPGAEFAGSVFAASTLFVNIQSKQGLTFAIWGPWPRGAFA